MGIRTFTRARDRLLAAAESELSSAEVCAEISLSVREVAPYDAAAVMNTDPETHLPAGGVVLGFDPSACAPFWDNELLDPDFVKFNDLARSHDPIATLADETDGDLSRSPRFTKLYEPFGASDELRVAFMSGASCQGIGSFVRCDGTTFSRTEVNDVRLLLAPAVNALRRALGNVGESVGPGGPVVILLGPDDRVLAMSDGAEVVLADLRLNRVDHLLPGTIRVAATKARSSRTPTGLTTRLRGASGRWVRIHVAPMDGDLDAVSVTIENARPDDIIPVLLDSYGLTEREIDIVLGVCRGWSTKELAAELAISVHTVRDHLKAVFEKSGVSSRGELVARLFAHHLLPGVHERVAHID